MNGSAGSRISLDEELEALNPWHFLIEIEQGHFTIPVGQWKTLSHNITAQDYVTRVLFPIISQLNIQPSNATLLDIGCNEGWLSLLFHRMGFKKIVGIDINEANIRKANFLKRHFNMENVEFHQADINNYSPDEAFDISIMLGVINHTHNPVCILENIRHFTKEYLVLDFDSLADDNKKDNRDIMDDADINSVTGKIKCHLEPAHQTTSTQDGNLVFQYSSDAMRLMMRYSGFAPITSIPCPDFAPPHYIERHRAMLIGGMGNARLSCEHRAAIGHIYASSKERLAFSTPLLVDEHARYNIVKYGSDYYGVPQGAMEGFDIMKVLDSDSCILGNSIEEIKELIGKHNSGIKYNRYLEKRDAIKYEVCRQMILQSRLSGAKIVLSDLAQRHLNPVTNLTARILYLQGRVNYKLGDTALAKKLWNKCISIDPDIEEAHIALSDLEKYDRVFYCHSALL